MSNLTVVLTGMGRYYDGGLCLPQKPTWPEQVIQKVLLRLSVKPTEDVVEKKKLFPGVDCTCNCL